MIRYIHPQLQQFINLFLLLFLGKYLALCYLSWLEIIYVLLGTLFIEYFFIYVKEREFLFFSYSSLSTAMGVMLMMITPNFYLYFVVIFFALFQKHFLQYSKKHFFNPSNFALILCLLFFYNNIHLALGQLGDNLWVHFVIISMGVAILYRVNRWIIPVSFIIFYILLEYLFVVSYDPIILFEDIYHRFYSVSFIVFILFMLTDPKTTPFKYIEQIIFSFAVASISVYLDRIHGFRVQHLFMALFLLSPLVVTLELRKGKIDKKYLSLITCMILLLALSAIIYIEMQPPYYFEMDG